MQHSVEKINHNVIDSFTVSLHSFESGQTDMSHVSPQLIVTVAVPTHI